jgi:plastocyanin
MKNNGMTVAIVVALIFGSGGFFAGTKYSQNQRGAAFRQANTTGAGGRFGAIGAGGGTRNGFRPVSGSIISMDDKSITVKLADGSSKIVLLTDKTQIGKAQAATKSDLMQGTQVAVFGSENSDGSVTAQSVQLNPQLMGRSGGTPNQATKSPDAKEIVVTGSNFKFDPSTITVKVGEKTRIVFKNSGGTHDFVVDELNLKTAMLNDGQEDFVEFTPSKVGKYEFYCSFGNHRAMGMKGTVIVQ